MPIYLIFNNMLKKYVCVNENGQNIPLRDAVSSNVDFLSKQMKCFENLRIECFFQRYKSVMLRNEKDEFFCSSNGNVPFLFTPIPSYKYIKTGRFEKFGLSAKKLPKFTEIQLTAQMVQILKTSWGERDYEREQHKDTATGIANGHNQKDLKRFADLTRQAINNNKIQREMNMDMEIDCINIKTLENLVGKQDGQVTDTTRQEPFFGISEEFFKYEANQEGMDAFEELGKQFIQQGCEPQAKSISRKCESKLQKQNRRM